MAVLKITFFVLFLVTVALSKPVSEGEDSSKESDSAEVNSSEEAATATQPQLPESTETETETEMPDAIEETEPTVTAVPPTSTEPSLVMLNATALPDPEDPQTSTYTDALPLPDDPSQPALGVDVSQDMPESNPAHDPINAGIEHVLPDPEVSPQPVFTGTGLIIGTDAPNQPEVAATTAATYQVFSKGATPPFPFSSSKASPLPIPIGTAMTGVPVCFTFQFTTQKPEPKPPRGDSM